MSIDLSSKKELDARTEIIVKSGPKLDKIQQTEWNAETLFIMGMLKEDLVTHKTLKFKKGTFTRIYFIKRMKMLMEILTDDYKLKAKDLVDLLKNCGYTKKQIENLGDEIRAYDEMFDRLRK